jgi:hypothetical protein
LKFILELISVGVSKGKGKGKSKTAHPVTGHEGPNGE